MNLFSKITEFKSSRMITNVASIFILMALATTASFYITNIIDNYIALGANYIFIILNSMIVTILIFSLRIKFPIYFNEIFDTGQGRFFLSEDKAKDLLKDLVANIDSASASKNKLIYDIESRVANLRRESAIIIISIFILLSLAVFVVIFAGRLTSIDVNASSNVDRLSTESKLAHSKLSQLYELSDVIPNLRSDNVSVRDDAQKKFQSLRMRDFPSREEPPSSKVAVDALIASAQDYVKFIDENLRVAWKKEIEAEKGYGDTKYMIASAITRVGVILVIVYLVQILIGLFRYNSRLMTFYNSKRDMIQIWSGKIDDLKKIEKLMVPNIDFGKEPKHPVEEIVQKAINKIPSTESANSGPIGKGVSS